MEVSLEDNRYYVITSLDVKHGGYLAGKTLSHRAERE
jgi:hypothetical protein